MRRDTDKEKAKTMPERTATIKRETKETRIELTLNLDGSGRAEIATGVGFFDHMLDHVARHGLMDLTIRADGDLHVDAHHTVEDVSICLGQALGEALGDKKGICRYGSASVPMDDSLANVSLDLSGRVAFSFNVRFPGVKIGQFDVELVAESLRALAAGAKMNLHVNVPYGENNHHIAEAIYKAVAMALRQAVRIDPRVADVPSTKGSL